MSAIAERYRAVRRQVADAADAVGRDPSEITIVAVSKTVGPNAIEQAIRAGISDFGENRAQELCGKHALFPDVRWHFVGTLQSRKVREVVAAATLIHSVDRMKVLRKIDEVAAEKGIVQRVLVQVNVSGEETKHGFHPSDVEGVLARAGDFPNVLIRGLMTMAPLGPAEQARPVFRGLAELFASLRGMRFNGVELEDLSMGMTNDYMVAVEEGATIIRVGRAIFGEGRMNGRNAR
ncbi:MAG: YggS family pyridoxal phosphate-dependent enzyme [Coriobacteriia bacterium]